MEFNREVLIGHTKEIEELLMRQYPDIVSDKGLLEANRQRNADLTELLRNQKRVLDLMAGEEIEPEVHEVSAVLHGMGSAGVG